MKKSLMKVFLILSLIIFAQTLSASKKSKLQGHFQNKLQSIKEAVADKTKTNGELYENIIKILTPIFDFELMAKLSLGKKEWVKLSKADKYRFVDLYTTRMKMSYSEKLNSYNGEKIDIYEIIRKKNKIFLKSSIMSNGKSIDVSYKFYKPKKRKTDKDEWLIYDVEILGVSILKADKAQFKDFLQTKSMPELMSALAKS